MAAGSLDGQGWAAALDCFNELVEMKGAAREAALASLHARKPAIYEQVLQLLATEDLPALELSANLPAIAAELFAEEADPYVGTTIGGYEVRSILGTGGMGRVYLAVHREYKGMAALKVLSDAISPERRARFELEKAHLASFQHPGIAQLYSAGTLPDGTPFFAMEYVEGLPITEFCAAGELGLRDRLRLFLQVCAAVQAAHGQGIIHRDLKPSNILVRPDVTVKLLDFGIAEGISGEIAGSGAAGNDAEADREAHRRTGLFVSLPYAPPEHTTKAAGVAGDVYSLGVILFELLTGEPAFAAYRGSADELRRAVCAGLLGRPSRCARGVAALVGVRAREWREIDHICARATALDAGSRYGTVDAIRRDVELFLGGWPLATLPPRWSYVGGKFLRRHRGPAAISAVAVLALIVLSAVYTVRLARARDRALAEAAHSARVERFLENLFDGGGGSAGPPAEMKVMTIVEDGVRNARALSNDPALQADLYRMLGGVYQDLAEYGRADELLTASLTERTQLFGTDSPERAEVLVELAKLRGDQRRLPEALALAEEAVGIDRRRLPANALETLRAETEVGSVDEHRGEDTRSVTILETVVRQEIETRAPLADLSEALNDLGVAEANLGHYERAEMVNQQAMEIDRKLEGERHPDIGEHLLTLAEIDGRLGRPEDAVAHAREALEIDRAWYGVHHPAVAAAGTMLAQALNSVEGYREAVPLLETSLAVQEPLYPRPASPLAQSLNAMAVAKLQAGQLEAADGFAQRAVSAYRAIYPQGSANIGIALANEARVALAKREFIRTEALALEALRFEQPMFPPSSPRLLALRGVLGRALLGEHKLADAEEQLLGSYQGRCGPGRDALDERKRVTEALAEVYRESGRPEQGAQLRTVASVEPVRRTP